MKIVQELFNSKALAANSTTTIFAANTMCSFSGFYCSAAGTVEIRDASDAVIIAAHAIPVTGFVVGGCICPNGLKIVLSGGCAGTTYFGTDG